MKSDMKSNTSPKNFLIITQYYYPDITAAAFRIRETVDILKSKGHNIVVVAAKPHKGESVNKIQIDDGGIKVIRVPIIKYRGKGKWNYILHYLSFMIMAILAGLYRVKGKKDVVIASSPPLFVGVAGLIVSKFKRARFVLDIRDIWPDSAVVTGQLSKNSLLYKYAKKVEKRLYKVSHLISCVAKPMAAYIGDIVDSKKVVVVYNGLAEKYSKLDNIEKSSSKNILLSKDKINIVYVGNMGWCQDLKLILISAQQIKNEGINNIVFYLIGDGVEKEELLRIKEEKQIGNVIIAGPVEKSEAVNLIYNSSVLFLQLKDDKTMEKTIPSKVFDYMIAGKPILFGIQGEGKEILSNVKGNIYFDSGSVESFNEALIKIQKNYNFFAVYAKENREIVIKDYSREKMVERLEERIQNFFYKDI